MHKSQAHEVLNVERKLRLLNNDPTKLRERQLQRYLKS